jgi:hypothetical protein
MAKEPQGLVVSGRQYSFWPMPSTGNIVSSEYIHALKAG